MDIPKKWYPSNIGPNQCCKVLIFLKKTIKPIFYKGVEELAQFSLKDHFLTFGNGARYQRSNLFK